MAVQEPHGPLGRRGARELSPTRRRRRAPAVGDCVEEPCESRAGRLAEVPQLGADVGAGLLLLQRGRGRLAPR